VPPGSSGGVHRVRRPAPQPLPYDGVGTVVVGTAVWALALIVLLPLHGRLADAGRTWWIATCAVGVGLGLLGVLYCKRRAARLRSAGRNPGA
jgi:hypothetical protein